MFADYDDARKPPSELPSVVVRLSGDDDFLREAKFGSSSSSTLLFDSAERRKEGFATFCFACLALFFLCTFVVVFVRCPLCGEDRLLSFTAGIFLSSSSSLLVGGS